MISKKLWLLSQIKEVSDLIPHFSVSSLIQEKNIFQSIIIILDDIYSHSITTHTLRTATFRYQEDHYKKTVKIFVYLIIKLIIKR